MEVLMAAPGFGERVQSRRRELGLSQAELAAAAGMHVQHVAKIEQGKRPNPSWETVLALSKALQVDPMTYFDPEQNPDPPPRPRRKRS